MKVKRTDKRGGVRVELGPEESQVPSARGTTTPVIPVFKLEQILVPVDFTDCTEKALAYAVPFARQFNATLTLLHVIEPAFVPATEMGALLDVDTSADAKRELDKLRDRIAGQVRCQIKMRKGIAESEIINAAKELPSDLIILSTHGRTGLQRLLLGSTVEKVVRRAGCPIFIVRPHEHDFIADEADANVESKYEEVKASM